MVRKTKAQKANFFVKFWNGDLSLPMSYWGVGLGLGLFLVFQLDFLLDIT